MRRTFGSKTSSGTSLLLAALSSRIKGNPLRRIGRCCGVSLIPCHFHESNRRARTPLLAWCRFYGDDFDFRVHACVHSSDPVPSAVEGQWRIFTPFDSVWSKQPRLALLAGRRILAPFELRYRPWPAPVGPIARRGFGIPGRSSERSFVRSVGVWFATRV